MEWLPRSSQFSATRIQVNTSFAARLRLRRTHNEFHVLRRHKAKEHRCLYLQSRIAR